jgi:hypothetical protein
MFSIFVMHDVVGAFNLLNTLHLLISVAKFVNLLCVRYWTGDLRNDLYLTLERGQERGQASCLKTLFIFFSYIWTFALQFSDIPISFI